MKQFPRKKNLNISPLTLKETGRLKKMKTLKISLSSNTDSVFPLLREGKLAL